MPEGQGTLTFNDGRIYRGAFKKGLSHGFGQLVCPRDKSIIERAKGYWAEGKLHGFAHVQYQNGVVYKGIHVLDSLVCHAVKVSGGQTTAGATDWSSQRLAGGTLARGRTTPRVVMVCWFCLC